ncbi:MAG: lysophospholipase [Pyrinomonadaceae bacterium]|nr:lysophospholipase [Pyrinomonadaceae bacterium]
MKKISLIIILLLPLLFFGAFFLAGSFLTSPVPVSVGDCPNDLVCENIEFPSDSGSLIKGWFVQGQEKKGVIVLMHGLRSNRLALIERIKFLQKAGFSVLAFDFQGSGESIGEKLTFGHLESFDATASLKFIKQKLPHEKVGVIGISMGGAAFLLQKEPQKVNALILEMVYPTIEKAVDNRLNMWLFNGADNLSPLMTMQFPYRLGVSANDLRPLDKIKNINCPIFFIVGEKDKHTTLAESQGFFETANQPKNIWIVPNAEHTDLHKISKNDYETKVLSFFAENLK